MPKIVPQELALIEAQCKRAAESLWDSLKILWGVDHGSELEPAELRVITHLYMELALKTSDNVFHHLKSQIGHPVGTISHPLSSFIYYVMALHIRKYYQEADRVRMMIKLDQAREHLLR